MSISRRIIRVRVLDDPHRPHVLIPKIRFKFRLKYGQSYKMMRCQFPVRLAYAFTYNRAQGQTLHKVLLDALYVLLDAWPSICCYVTTQKSSKHQDLFEPDAIACSSL